MLKARLSAYGSDMRVLSVLIGTKKWKQRFLAFAGGSPRDFLRILKTSVDEAVRQDPNATKIHQKIKETALDNFCVERSRELTTPRLLERLKVVGLLDFTVSDFAKNLGIGTQSARNYIRSLVKAGMIRQDLEPVYTRTAGAPPALYLISDSRVGRVVQADLTLDQFVKSKVKACPEGHAIAREWDIWVSALGNCAVCGANIDHETKKARN